MSSLASARHAQLDSIARDTGFGRDAVDAMYDRIVAGGGRMAQFDHPAFGGPGQWMQGGMTMIGVADDALRARVGRLCEALAAFGSAAAGDGSDGWRHGGSQLSGGTSSVEDPERLADVGGAGAHRGSGERQAPATWYPPALGRPDSSGTQDHTRYAWFASARRLALDDGHGVTVYDTGDHRIGGVSQQQGADRSVAFTSQHGRVDLATLPVVSGDDATEPEIGARRAAARPPSAPDPAPGAPIGDDPFTALERLADLHRRGIVDDDEYRAKKAELLGRI